MVILSYANAETRLIGSGKRSRYLAVGCQETALRKLAQLDAATTLQDLKAPPGNRLEALKGNRAGQHSIRINDQWRVCFVWTDQGHATSRLSIITDDKASHRLRPDCTN